MSTFTPVTTLLLAPAALIAAADAALGPAATQQLSEVEQLFTTRLLQEAETIRTDSVAEEYRMFARESRDVIEHFRRTGDARRSSPTLHLTLLHLACSCKEVELVQELLAAGADPNALIYSPMMERALDGCFTLTLCSNLVPGQQPCTQEGARRIIDMLVAAGGDPRGSQAGTALYLLPAIYGNFDGAEDIALHLLALGTDPANNLMSAGDVDDEDDEEAELDPVQRHLATFLYYSADKGWARVVGQVLQSGRYTDIDATYNQRTILCELARNMVDYRDEEKAERLFAGRATCFALLLRHGAKPSAVDPIYDPGATVADYIHSNPRLLIYLTERGISIPRTPRELGEYSLAEDLKKLPKCACPPIETLTPLEDAMAALLAQESAECRQEKLLRLMRQVDEARTAKRVMQLPQWQGDREWTKAEQELLTALHATMPRALPARWLEETARHLDAAGHSRAAHSLVAMLAQHPEAAPLVETLCASGCPSLASAAWTARLRLAGLDNLPLLDVRKLAEPGSDLYMQLRRLRHGLDLVTDIDDDERKRDFYLDFARADNSLGWTVNILEWEEAPIPRQEARGALVAWLRDHGARAEANYLGELHQIYSLSHPRRSKNELLLDDAREWLANFGKERREARFAELVRPEQVEPVAYAVETLLGRYLWELYRKHAK